MPPPDTLIVNAFGDTAFLIDGDTIYINQDYPLKKSYENIEMGSSYPEKEWHPPFGTGVIVLLFIGVVVFIFFGPEWLGKLFHSFFGLKAHKAAVKKAEEMNFEYDGVLKKYNPYYAALSLDDKQRFLLRTVEFMQAKEFRYHSMQEEAYIPVLISGAAVQITFGLKNFLMDYFPIIHIIKKEYVLEMDKETYYGHVSRTGIYISWNHFLEGFADYTDSMNVGLHEMAHAISFDIFLGQQDRHDFAFKKRLKDFVEEGKPVFRAMRQGASHLLDDYGATNFDEFWAVCVETFFENPLEFNRNMPDLYISIVELLNQDPLKPGKIINRNLAGLVNLA